jgi:hypothetical protein
MTVRQASNERCVICVPVLTTFFLARCCRSTEYYQLEEMEDKDTCTTELFLKPDGVIEFGDTDGPQPIASEGHWLVPDGTNDYSMTIKRSFEAGKGNSDIGEFNYDRKYIS